MEMSVLIPTLGRSKELIETVRALLDQTVLPDEIVVIDQNSPSQPEVDEFLSSIERVRHFRVIEPGVAVNYNRALQAARGRVVLFIDDDVIPEKNLIEAHLKHYHRGDPPVKDGKKIGGVAGRVINREGDQPLQEIHEVGRYHLFSGRVVGNFNGEDGSWVDCAQGANMSFLREALLSVGGFDQGFVGNGYFFETDACLRLVQKGYGLWFDPEACLYHLMAPSGGARVPDKASHTYFFTRNGIRLYRRHSPLWGQPLFAARLAAYSIAKGAYNRDFKISLDGIKGIVDGFAKGRLASS